MSKHLYVKPAHPGAVVRDPRSLAMLPAQGGRVPASSYWVRRLNAGDVVEVKPAGKPAKPKTARASKARATKPDAPAPSED